MFPWPSIRHSSCQDCDAYTSDKMTHTCPEIRPELLATNFAANNQQLHFNEGGNKYINTQGGRCLHVSGHQHNTSPYQFSTLKKVCRKKMSAN